MNEICQVCGFSVNPTERESHLREAHPAPEGGFTFHYDARPYRTDKPSMMVSELLMLVNGQVTYHLYQGGIGPDGERIFIPARVRR